MKVSIIIPARYKSSRLPGKPLISILNIPMIIRVADICKKVVGVENVFIATDDKRISKKAKKFGYKFIITSKKCLTGTDRVAEASKKINSDIIVNVQGDEPLLNPQDIKKIIKEKKKNFDQVINGYSDIEDNLEPSNKNIPKVIFNNKKNLIYMSRNLLPGHKKNAPSPNKYFKQVCVYAFNKKELNYFYSRKKKSIIEFYEDIEILRFLESDIKIKMIKLSQQSIAVDVPKDVKKVEKEILKKIKLKKL